MDRRSFLAATSSVVVSGCLGATSEDSDKSGEPTVRTTEQPAITVRNDFDLGEWHAPDGFGYSLTVADYWLSTSFYDADRESRVEMPDDKQLLFAVFRFKNISQQQISEPGLAYLAGVTADGTTAEARPDFEHPDYKYSASTANIESERLPSNHLDGDGEPRVKSGETLKRWTAFVLPREVEREAVGVAFEELGAEMTFLARWR